jgi:hypothetical protein
MRALRMPTTLGVTSSYSDSQAFTANNLETGSRRGLISLKTLHARAELCGGTTVSFARVIEDFDVLEVMSPQAECTLSGGLAKIASSVSIRINNSNNGMCTHGPCS